MHAVVLQLQAPHGLVHLGAHRVAGQQKREHVAFLVLMVVRAGQVEIALHVGAGGAALRVVAVGVDVFHDAAQQPQAALHALMAGGEHLERLVEAGGRAAETGEYGLFHGVGGRHAVGGIG